VTCRIWPAGERHRARGAAWILAIGVVAAPVGHGQSQAQGKAEALPAFAGATVRIRPAINAPPSISPVGTAHFTATNVPMEVLIELAFGVEATQVVGTPSWFYTVRYDVDATPKSGVILTQQQLRLHLQQLLAERFKVATHRETKVFDGYRLVVAKGGPKLRKTAGVSTPGSVSPNGLKLQNISIADFAPILATPTGRPVVDKTGIQGNYDIDLNYTTGAATASHPSIFAALQDQLGLVLEPQKVPIEMLIIDHVDEIPTEK
jgi:uncharacterized protein (TIGR03435 family)